MSHGTLQVSRATLDNPLPCPFSLINLTRHRVDIASCCNYRLRWVSQVPHTQHHMSPMTIDASLQRRDLGTRRGALHVSHATPHDRLTSRLSHFGSFMKPSLYVSVDRVCRVPRVSKIPHRQHHMFPIGDRGITSDDVGREMSRGMLDVSRAIPHDPLSSRLSHFDSFKKASGADRS